MTSSTIQQPEEDVLKTCSKCNDECIWVNELGHCVDCYDFYHDKNSELSICDDPLCTVYGCSNRIKREAKK